MNAPQSARPVSNEPGWGLALLASLPRSLCRGGPDADIILLDGRGDWTDIGLALVQGGSRHILLIDPAAAPPVAIERLARAVDASDTILTISESLAGNPTIVGFKKWLGTEFGIVSIVSTDAMAPRALLLAQLRLLRAAGIRDVNFGHFAESPAAFLAEASATLAGSPIHVRLSAAQSAAGDPHHLVTAYAATALARLDLRPGGEARPAKASLSTAEGLHELPSIHESAHRHNLRALPEAASADPAGALLSLVDDIALAAGGVPVT